MVVALIALIASVTSGAYAAVRITTANIADRAVTHPKLATNSAWHANIGRHSVRNGNLAPNSVWHAQIGTGSVQLANIQPATADQLRSTSAAFANTGPTTLTAATQGVRVAGGTISITAGALVLNGFVIVSNVATTGDVAVCDYVIDGSSVSATQLDVPAKSGVQIGMVARDPVKAGTHTVNVFCRSIRAVDLIADSAPFTAIATG
jgi:hypothetical protein